MQRPWSHRPTGPIGRFGARLTAGLVTVAIAVVGCGPPPAAPTGDGSTGPAPGGIERGLVLEVADGDSLLVSIDGPSERVRLLGVNAPELDECYGDEARRTLVGLLSPGGEPVEVALEADVEDRDRFGRLLRWVWVGPVLVNVEQARTGAAFAWPSDGARRYRQEVLDAETQARAAGAGLWTACRSPAWQTVRIVTVQADPPGRDEDHLEDEIVVIAADRPVDASGWILRDGSSAHRFVFAAGTRIDGEIVIATGCDVPPDRIPWCAGGPVWDNGGDIAMLLDAQGRLVDVFRYP